VDAQRAVCLPPMADARAAPAAGSSATVPTQPVATGFEYVGPVNANLICSICTEPFLDPQALPCGHTFCRTCITTALCSGPVPQCPVDRLPARLGDLTPAGRVVTNMVDELLVYCPQRRRGCGAVVERQHAEAHLRKDCEVTVVPCGHAGCDVVAARSDIDEHRRACPRRAEACQLCGDLVVHADAEVRGSGQTVFGALRGN